MFSKKFLVENRYIIGILAVALVLRVWGINFGMPDFFPHTDETYALSKAIHFFEPELRPDMGVTIFHLWGWIFYQVLSFFKVIFTFSAGSELTTVDFMWWARLVNAVMSTGSVWLVYLISSKLKVQNSKLIGLLAALFLAVTFVDVQTAHYFRQDTYIQFLGLLLVYLYLKKPEKIYWWVFGMGVVAALRITAWVYLVPVLVDWWFRVEKSWKVKLGNLTMLGVLSVGGWLAGHPDAYFRGVFGEYLGNYFKFFTKSSFDWVGGDTSNGVPNYVWWFKYLNYTGLFATMFGLFAGSYVWSLVRVKKFMRERSWFYLGVLLAIGLYFTALMIRSVKFDRHFVPLTPLVAIVSGYGLWQTKVWLVNIFKQWGKLILSMVLLLIFGFPLIRSLLFVYQIGLIDTRPAAMEWVMDNYGKDQVIISSGEANIITQNLQKHGYRKVVNFFPIVKYEELGEQVSGGLFLITSWDYRVCENYQKVKQMRDCWQAYQRIKEKFELLKQFAPPVVDGRLFGLDELELSSTVNAYHNPVVEVYRITADM